MMINIEESEYFDESFENLKFEPGGFVSVSFSDCKFINCDFTNTSIIDSRFSECEFIDCDLSLAKIKGSSFPSSIFKSSKLLGINWTTADWSSSSFGILKGFENCVLSHSTFIELELEGIQIKDCIAHDVDFRNADLTKVNFKGTDLKNCLFMNTNLTKADLSKAYNYDIDPGSNIVKQASFSLPEAMSLLYNMEINLINSD